jgi:hypothetical protein
MNNFEFNPDEIKTHCSSLDSSDDKLKYLYWLKKEYIIRKKKPLTGLQIIKCAKFKDSFLELGTWIKSEIKYLKKIQIFEEKQEKAKKQRIISGKDKNDLEFIKCVIKFLKEKKEEPKASDMHKLYGFPLSTSKYKLKDYVILVGLRTRIEKLIKRKDIDIDLLKFLKNHKEIIEQRIKFIEEREEKYKDKAFHTSDYNDEFKNSTKDISGKTKKNPNYDIIEAEIQEEFKDLSR